MTDRDQVTERGPARDRDLLDQSQPGGPSQTRRPQRTAGPTVIAPPRDTGITLTSPRERHARHREKVRLQRIQLGVMAAIVLVALVATWIFTQPSGTNAAGEQASVGPLREQAGVAATPLADPTPLFATHGDLQLYLPVPPESLTELAFHQASGEYAKSLDSLLPDADMALAAENRGTGRGSDQSTQTDAAESHAEDSSSNVLDGCVLRMWRSNRSGPCNTAADIGAPPGTTVFAPITGRVVDVRPYLLYGEHDDVEIHIRPEGRPELDLVLIHIGEISIEEGDEVIGGVTPIAKIRLLSDRVTPQLGQYTWDGGDHVHIQLNEPEAGGMLPTVEEGS